MSTKTKAIKEIIVELEYDRELKEREEIYIHGESSIINKYLALLKKIDNE